MPESFGVLARSMLILGSGMRALESENPDHKDRDRVFRQVCCQPAYKICHKLQVLSRLFLGDAKKLDKLEL